MAMPPYFIRRCQHVKANGIRCGSPALRRSYFCYFHKRWRKTHPRLRPAPVTLSPAFAQHVRGLIQQRHISWSRLVDELLKAARRAEESEKIVVPPPEPQHQPI